MSPHRPLPRRTFLGSSALSAILATTPLKVFAQANISEDMFLSMSKFLTGHEGLDASVGRGLLAGLRAVHLDFDVQFSALKDKMDGLNPADVEALVEAVKGTALHETLLAVIRGWYSGVVAEGTQATVYTFEKALMYQPSIDAVPIPTYALDGPDWWTVEPPALSAMPRF